jgi:tetratricopeptide (TPR) repeat protein
VAAGFVSPARGPRGAFRFSFQDLIVLRTAQGLAEAKVPQRRITRSVRELRRHLPDAMPLSGLSITAEGDRVVVRQGGDRWQAESGQYLLEFEGDPAAGPFNVVERKPPVEADDDAQGWFARGAALEVDDASAAREAYERAIAADPAFVDARVNLGRLLHETKDLAGAERVYREALSACGDDAILWFNLGVLFDDLGRTRDAAKAYESAVRVDPTLADGHYNLALLYEALEQPKDAIRHMARYRALVGGAK